MRVFAWRTRGANKALTGARAADAPVVAAVLDTLDMAHEAQRAQYEEAAAATELTVEQIQQLVVHRPREEEEEDEDSGAAPKPDTGHQPRKKKLRLASSDSDSGSDTSADEAVQDARSLIHEANIEHQPRKRNLNRVSDDSDSSMDELSRILRSTSDDDDED